MSKIAQLTNRTQVSAPDGTASGYLQGLWKRLLAKVEADGIDDIPTPGAQVDPVCAAKINEILAAMRG